MNENIIIMLHIFTIILIYLVKHPQISLYISPRNAQESQNSKPIVESHNNDVIKGC